VEAASPVKTERRVEGAGEHGQGAEGGEKEVGRL